MYNDPFSPFSGQPSAQWLANDAFATGPMGRSRGIAALLAIFFGVLGLQYFYMGKTSAGIIFLLITVCSCGILGCLCSLIGIIQGVYMLGLNNRQFEFKYVSSRNQFPLF